MLRTYAKPAARTCTGGTALEPSRSEHPGGKRRLYVRPAHIREVRRARVQAETAKDRHSRGVGLRLFYAMSAESATRY